MQRLRRLCQRVHSALNGSRGTIGGERGYFRERIIMGIMFLGSQKTPVLHKEDDGARFSDAVLMKDGTSHQ